MGLLPSREVDSEAALRAARRLSAMSWRSAKRARSRPVVGASLLTRMALPVTGSLATNVNSATRLGSTGLLFPSPCHRYSHERPIHRHCGFSEGKLPRCRITGSYVPCVV